MRRVANLCALFFLILTVSLQPQSQVLGDDEAKADDDMKAKYEKLTKMLTGAKLVGKYTMLGKDDDKLPKEEYTILSAEKLPKEDWWGLKARIQYGGKDVTVPMALRIKWAGDTPVITLTDLTIPGLGTFSSRVVMYNNKYAGTWTHDKHGGHLFGTIERAESEAENKTESEAKE